MFARSFEQMFGDRLGKERKRYPGGANISASNKGARTAQALIHKPHARAAKFVMEYGKIRRWKLSKNAVVTMARPGDGMGAGGTHPGSAMSATSRTRLRPTPLPRGAS
jgi:hypothetical protein